VGAFVLSAGLFLFWLVAGRALLALLHTRHNLLQELLLAPVAGLACTVLPLFVLHRAGLPVACFGPWVGAGLLAASVAVLLWLRPPPALRPYSPFAGVLLLGLFLTGRPLLEFGFDWMSYCNPDATFYCLAAQRFLHHGFFDMPPARDLLEGRDYSLFTWFFHPWFGIRPGAELVLAWLMSVTGLSPLQLYMPVILAFHGVLLSALGALLCRGGRWRRTALAGCALLAVSPLNTLGTLLQVIGQVPGIAFLIGGVVLLCRPFRGMSRPALVRHGVLAGLVAAGHVLIYPESVPFLVLGFAGYQLVRCRRDGLPWRELLPVLGSAAVVCAVCLRGYLLEAALFFHGQQSVGLTSTASLFPYFLVPGGLANLWGLLPLAATLPEPWMSAAIWVGGQLLLAVTVAAVWLAWRRNAAAVVLLVMLGLAALLFSRQSGFGLFKLAMFMQPFLIATVVTVWSRLFTAPSLRPVPLWLLAGACLLTQTIEVEGSRSVGDSSMVEIPQASARHVLGQFRDAVRSLPDGGLILGTENYVLARFEGLYTQGRPALFLSHDYFADHALMHYAISTPRWVDRPAVLAVGDALRRRCVPRQFDLHDPDHPDAVNSFNQLRVGEAEQEPHKYVVAEGPLLTVLNRWHPWPDAGGAFSIRPLEEVRNHLCLISSERGRIYGPWPGAVGLYRLENDVLVPGQSMAGAGREQLYQVLNPSATVRLVLGLSSTLKGDGENRLPPAAAIGHSRERFDLVGRGSARVVSPPLVPQSIGGRDYLGVDLGVSGTSFASTKGGLQNAYGRELQADHRAIVCFARDISLISEEEYAALTPPSKLCRFPEGLMNPHLEYSGVCEDGWVSSRAYFYLTQESEHRQFVVSGLVPGLKDNPNFATVLRVLVDGKEVLRERLVPGEFRFCVDAPPGMGRRRVDLLFSADQKLLPPDNRPMAAMLKKIGFALEFEDETADTEEDEQ
jgi:hypothetical protein